MLAKLEALKSSLSVLFSQMQSVVAELKSEGLLTDILLSKRNEAETTLTRLAALEISMSELVKQNQSFMSELIIQNQSIISEINAKIGSDVHENRASVM
jgi:hypothetical protein